MPAGGSRRCSRNGLIVGCGVRKHGADYRRGTGHSAQVADFSQMQLQARERVEAQEKELWRLSALLEKHQAVLRCLPERHHQVPLISSNFSQLRHEVIVHLPSTVNTIRGAASKTGPVLDLGRPPIVKRHL